MKRIWVVVVGCCVCLAGSLLVVKIVAQLGPTHVYSRMDWKGAVVHAVQIDVRRAPPALYQATQGLEPVSEQARRVEARVAVNGGFFRADGAPAGVLKIAGEFVSARQSKPRGLLAWRSGDPLAAVITRATVSDGQVAPVWEADKTIRWQDMDNVLGGIPVLVTQGRARTDLHEEQVSDKFLREPNARTAVCLTKRHWTLVSVEGRPRGSDEGSRGLTLAELAELLESRFACDAALNLDGGSSSTLFEEDRVANQPKYGLELPVANILYFKER